MKFKIVLILLFVFYIWLAGYQGVYANKRMNHLTTRITRIEQEYATAKQRQIDLIKYNDCYVCHEEGKRCELINGVVWEWEEEK